MLRLEHLTVHYGAVAAVRDIELHCAEGEIVGMVGLNGAGKTTTLRAVAGALPASSVGGRVLFRGRDLVGVAPEEIVRTGLILVPEGRRIFTSLTVEENLALGAARHRDGSERQAAELMERFPVLGRDRHAVAGQLSGGEQQQLALARALMSRPDLIMIDEPSLGLAPILVEEVFDLIKELRERGATVLLVEQNARRALELVDRCYVLRHGEVRLETAGAAKRDEQAFLEAYFGTHADGKDGQS